MTIEYTEVGPALDTKTLGSLFDTDAVSPEARKEITDMAQDLPELSANPQEALITVFDYLNTMGFVYEEKIASLDDVLSNKTGSCLGLSILVTALLIEKGQKPLSKILVHPRDPFDTLDRDLFSTLMTGGLIDYNHPKLPKVSDQTDPENPRIHRFVPLAHPIVILNGQAFETTLIGEPDSNPLVEFAAESGSVHESAVLGSYLYSDEAKLLYKAFNGIRPSEAAGSDFLNRLTKSTDIFPENRDALSLLVSYGRMIDDSGMMKQAMDALIAIGPVDSDMSYKLWLATKDESYLNRTLEQFPEDIPAFLDRKVFLERDPREARANLAVAMWCICYSSTFDLKDFYGNPQFQKKVKELFP